MEKRKRTFIGRRLVVLVFMLFAGTATGWCQKLSLEYSNKPLTVVLNNLSERYNFKIAFDPLLADKTLVSVSVSKASIDEVLSKLMHETGLTVQRMGDVYMIMPKTGTVEDEKPVVKPPVTETIRNYIYGIIKDKLSGEALPFASIYLSENHLGTLTDADGFFKLETIAEDTVRFVVYYMGYAPQACSVFPEKKPKLQTFLMEPQYQMLQDVVVSKRLKVFDNSGINVERIRFIPSRMNNIPSLTELDIMAPLQMLPGINATNENAGGFSLHNASPDKTLLVYDGFTIYHMNHFFGAFSSINNKAVKDIQVFKNGFGANLGGSTAGIIQMTGKSGNMQKPVVNAGADMLAADVEVEIPLVKNKCSFLFAGRRSFTDVYRSPLYNTMFSNVRYDFSSYYRKPPVAFTSGPNDPSYMFGDLHTKITFLPTENSLVSVTLFGSSDKLSFSQQQSFPKMTENTRWGTTGVSLRWSGKLAKNWQSEIVAGSSKSQFDYSFVDSIIRERKGVLGVKYNNISRNSSIHSWLRNTLINWNHSVDLPNNQQLNAGISMAVFESLYNYNAQTYLNNVNIMDTSRIYQKKTRLSTLWLQYRFTGEKWECSPGIRFNKYNIGKKTYPEFRISGLYRLNPALTLKANAGNYFQFVNKINISKKGDFRSVWLLSDGNRYPVVSSFSVSGGFNYDITSTINLDIETYFIKTNNLFSSIEEYRFVNNAVKIGNVSWLYGKKVSGMDLLLKQTYGKYQLWTAYTLEKSISSTTIKTKSIEYPSDNNQIHEIKLLHMLKIKNWVLSFSNIYGSGVVWDHYVLNDNLRLSNNYQKNGERVPNYLRIDAGLNHSFRIKNTEWKIGCNVFNILDHKNIIQRFDKLSETPALDISQGIDPIQENNIYGLGISSNFFINVMF